MSRSARLVLITPDGDLLGALPPVELECPYWPESADVVSEARTRFGVEVTVLRLLRAELPQPPGGAVTYLAELASGTPRVELQPVSVQLTSDPKRMPWAELGGPARSLEWARAALGGAAFHAVQHRTWNLSSLWRLERPPGEPVWLKQVPPFMKCESRVLGWLNRAAPAAAPQLLAADDEGRSLLAHVPGEDLYGAPVALRERIIEQLHVIQVTAAQSIEELSALGIPDLRGPRRSADIREKLRDWPEAEPLLQSLDLHLRLLEECGLPDTLVHADNHPGNARGSLESIQLLDWGEAFIGSPVTDVLAVTAGLSESEARPLLAGWCAGWKRVAPHARPERALELAPFLSELSGAALYAFFLTQIEASEHPYHRADVPRCLASARALLLG